MVYKTDKASGVLWLPNLKDDEEEVERLRKSFAEAVKPENIDEEWLGSFSGPSFDLEELYLYEQAEGLPEIEVSGDIGGVFVSLQIPVENTEQMRKFVESLSKYVTIDQNSSGLYLKPKDFTEVQQKKTDGQGRVNLGKEYADREVRVVVMDTKEAMIE